MSPTSGNEVYITELETEILNVFLKHRQLNDKEIVKDLKQLINKLEK